MNGLEIRSLFAWTSPRSAAGILLICDIAVVAVFGPLLLSVVTEDITADAPASLIEVDGAATVPAISKSCTTLLKWAALTSGIAPQAIKALRIEFFDLPDRRSVSMRVW